MPATPYLELNLSILASTAGTLVDTFPEIDFFYALKSNPDTRVLQTLQRLGLGMEIASGHELQLVQSIGIESSRTICLHPIKSPDFLRCLHKAGVTLLAVDTSEELLKIAEFAPGSSILIRISTPFAESQIPLSGKFGCDSEEAFRLFDEAKSLKLNPTGITFHVGSQCHSIATWRSLIHKAILVERQLRQGGHAVHWISLGGGLPARYSAPTLEWSDIASSMRDAGLSDLRQRTKLTFELGRSMVASCGRLVTTVIGTATRGKQKWVYLDAGIFHGLFETLPFAGGIRPLLDTHDSPNMRLQQLAGPTCDDLDTIGQAQLLPDLSVGEKLFFCSCGAYSASIATTFNGFPAPQSICVNPVGCDDSGTSTAYMDFNPHFYLKQYYTRDRLTSDDFSLVSHLIEFTSQGDFTHCTALDFGCGPTLHYAFAIAPRFQNISLADYLPANLEAAREWIDVSPNAHDWDPLFTAVLECEGVFPSALQSRKETLRTKIDSLISCNIRNITPIDSTKTFDFVMSFFCLECVASSTTEWCNFLGRICSLLKTNGRLFMAAIANGKQYKILDKWLPTFPPSQAEILMALKMRFAKVDIVSVAAPDWTEDGFDQIYIIKASN